MSTVVVVDDDALFRELLVRWLRDQHHVRAFASPDHALAAIEADPPGLLITDFRMPEMDGDELVRRLRNNGHEFPVFVVSGEIGSLSNMSDMGVRHVFEKPIKDKATFLNHVQSAAWNGDTPVDGMDRVGLEFLAELSHEIRTPLTAVKLALDGMFAQQSTGPDLPKRRLLDISQRNVDRIIRVVEDQLNLLQVSLGSVAISRRLTRLRRVFESSFFGLDESTVMSNVDELDPKIYMFTDGDRLTAVLRQLVTVHPGDEPARVEGTWHEERVVIDVWRGVMGDLNSADSPCACTPPLSGLNARACERLVEALGGRLTQMHQGDQLHVRLELPVCPAYDKRSDFITPLRDIRTAARLNEKPVTLFRCSLEACEAAEARWRSETEFLQRCLSTLSDGDLLVRGANDGTYYLAVVAQSPDEMDHHCQFLRGTGDAPLVDVMLLQTVLPGQSYPEDLLTDLEAFSSKNR